MGSAVTDPAGPHDVVRSVGEDGWRTKGVTCRWQCDGGQYDRLFDSVPSSHSKRWRLRPLSLASNPQGRTARLGSRAPCCAGRWLATGHRHVFDQHRADRFAAAVERIGTDRNDLLKHVFHVASDGDLFDRILDHAVFDPVARRPA